MKTMVSALSFFKSKNNHQNASEAIIPFQDEDIITFSYFFSKDNPNVRGGKQNYSITAIFKEKDRLRVYDEANNLSDLLKRIGRLIEIHVAEHNIIPLEFIEICERLLAECSKFDIDKVNHEYVTFYATCPICSHKDKVNLKRKIEELKIVEYTIYRNDLCSHQFSVYVNSKFEILGYKEPKIDILKLKELIWKIKTPYDSLLEGKIAE